MSVIIIHSVLRISLCGDFVDRY